jgi:hypothetical protein
MNLQASDDLHASDESWPPASPTARATEVTGG